MNVAALILAAGKGVRAGGELPKQFQQIAGKSLIAHAVSAFWRHGGVDSVHVVIAPGEEKALQDALAGEPVTSIIAGGAERQHSVFNGLEALAADGSTTHVLIHDAARPFVPIAVIDRLLESLQTHAGATPALPVVDTLAVHDEGLGAPVDRSQLVRIQTPQAFHLDAILAAHRGWQGQPATDDAQMLRAAGQMVALIEGDPMLDKITHPADFATAAARNITPLISRTGMGFDVHRLEPGKPLWLCGIQVPYNKGLSGHSDADVALHAIVDALLGAIGDGDIGTHFPPSDPQWKGAASHLFAEHAVGLIARRGGIIDHVDVTIICEAPKIGPHRAAMRTALATMLRLDEQRISIKATTTERLGFAGRGEGIAAQAIATVRI